jgi:hypothetical protein
VRCGGSRLLVLPPRGGRGAYARVRGALREGVAADGIPAASLASALERVRRVASQPGLVVVASDFRDDGAWQRPLRRRAARLAQHGRRLAARAGAEAAMSFAAPLNLLAALVVPLLAGAFARRRRRRYAVRFPAAVVLAGVRPSAPAWRRWVGPTLLGLAALAAVASLARPQAVVAVPIERASVMLVTDTSGSMASTDVAPARLGAVRSAVSGFLDDVPDSLLVGFQSYASGTRAAIAPSTDRAKIRSALDALQAQGGTATGDTLTAALDQLQARRGKDGSRAQAAIVVLSDGAVTEGADPLIAAARARRLGTRSTPSRSARRRAS